MGVCVERRGQKRYLDTLSFSVNTKPMKKEKEAGETREMEPRVFPQDI